MILHDDTIRKILETTVQQVSYEREKRIIDEKETSDEYELLNEKNISDVNVSDEPSNRTISDKKKYDKPNKEYECTERKNDSMEMKSRNENKLSYKPASIEKKKLSDEKISDTTVNDGEKPNDKIDSDEKRTSNRKVSNEDKPRKLSDTTASDEKKSSYRTFSDEMKSSDVKVSDAKASEERRSSAALKNFDDKKTNEVIISDGVMNTNNTENIRMCARSSKININEKIADKKKLREKCCCMK